MNFIPSITTSRRRFLAQAGMAAIGAGLVPQIRCLAASKLKEKQLPRSTPEAEGVDSQAILNFVQAIRESRHEFHSLILARHGKIIAEGYWAPYRAEAPQMMYSMSKSFTSTAIGFAAAEGRLKVEDRVISFFPEAVPEQPSENLKALRVRDLLSMSVGHAQDSTGSLWPQDDWVRTFLALPVPNEPGTAFLYNSGATYMLSAIISKITGRNLVGYLTPRLFEPLGIENISWETCPHGINTGGWGLKIQTQGLAKFGQLYLQNGHWNGQQLIPRAWVEEATTFKIQQPSPDLERAKQESDWHQGYCYQFWRSRHNCYRGDGAFGQFTLVMPDQEAVVAITSETSDMQGVLNLVWEHLIPAMKPVALAPNKGAESRLECELKELALRPPEGLSTSALAERFSKRSYVVSSSAAPPSSVSLEFLKQTCVFRFIDQRGQHAVHCGLGKWVDGQTDMPGTPPKLTQGRLPPVSKVAAAGAWKDDRTFEMAWRYYETPHHDKVTCRFGEDTIRVEFLDSMTAMNPSRKDKRAPLEGRRQG